ncbi:helix-turn-helix transcriptional regulator [Actinomadura parmotrematis]|uniref:LuxR family transcriptional regulator n=1 Tax=Actinomadura parmotrematis TaxID=2864039 RepID=A0ABS7G1W7_9ACTN|nr:LuxR family transcriptional regulator [Actinomadura parmotrematis]MBW8486210.1 LuxR family transcriptional regulator [Actinomadura parmotrematis]
MERDEQILQLDALVQDCLAGRGRVALLEGPLGTGRTALLRALAERAERSGFRCLRASCSPAEQALPYGVAGQLLRGVPRGEGGADGPSARLLDEVAAGGADAGPASPEAVRAHHGLSLALLGLAEREPLLITVDDLRHADVASLHLLLHLVRRLGPARVLVVLADEAAPRPRHLTFLAELFRRPELRRLRLGPLSPDGTARAAAELLGPAAPGPAPGGRPDLHAVSGGNPLLLDALAEDVRVAGAPRAEGYGLAFLACLHRGDPATAAVARALAIMGEDADPAELWRLVGLSPEDAGRALGSLDDAAVLDGGRFRHPVARAAVLADLAPAERADLHRRAARLLHDRGAPATRVADHLAAADHAQEPWAPAVLSEAAEHALLDDRAEAAARFLRLAHRGLPGEAERAAVRARLAGAEWQTSPSSAARHLAPLVTAALGGRLGLADGLALVERLLWFGRGGEAVRVLDRLRADARPESGGGLHDAEVWLAYAHPPLARDRRTPVLAADRHFAVPAPGGDPQLHAVAILADGLIRRRGHGAVARAEQVLRDLPLHLRNPWTVEAAPLAVQVLLRADRLDAAAAWCESSAKDAGAEGSGTRAAFFAAARAEVALRTGDLPSAMREARAALERLGAKSWGVAAGYPIGTFVLAATRAGEHDEAAKLLALSVPDAMFQTRHGLGYLYARGHHHLAAGHAHAALADFLSCGELIRGWGLDTAGPVPWRTDAAEAWLRLGNRDQARRLIREQLARTDGRGPALRLLAAASPVGRRLPLLTEAVDLAEASGDRYEQARVLADLSRVHAAGNRRRARLLLRQALHVANMCGMRPLARELLSVQADLGGAEAMADGLEGVASLTDSERRVASLAVVGNTNREIAAKLYITPSTVEQHLTRIYRKLGIRRRKELPADLWAGLRKTG